MAAARRKADPGTFLEVDLHDKRFDTSVDNPSDMECTTKRTGAGAGVATGAGTATAAAVFFWCHFKFVVMLNRHANKHTNDVTLDS